MGGLKFGKDGDGNYGYYGADGSLIPFKRYKTATRSNVYSLSAGYQIQCIIDFSDAFPNAILGVTSIHKTGDAVVGAFNYQLDGIAISNVNRTITLPVYAGTGGTNRDVSGTVTVTAIGY